MKNVPLPLCWRQEGRGYSSHSFSNSALMRVSDQRHALDALYPGEGPPVPIVQEAGWASEPVWTQRLEENMFKLCRESNPSRPVIFIYIYICVCVCVCVCVCGNRRGSTWPRGYTPCWQVYTKQTRVMPFIPTKSVACMSTSWLLGNVYMAKSCKGKKPDPDAL
jgi:hypothetical protein